MSDTNAEWHYVHVQQPSVFTQPEVAHATMRRFAERCDGRKSGRCKACAYLLKALDEIALLRGVPKTSLTTTTP